MLIATEVKSDESVRTPILSMHNSLTHQLKMVTIKSSVATSHARVLNFLLFMRLASYFL